MPGFVGYLKTVHAARFMRRQAMSYIDGFVLAVPTANKEKFLAHARAGDVVFIEYGALRVVECWG